MKILFSAFFLALFCTPLAAQANDVIASASGISISLGELSEEARAAFVGKSASMAELRKRLFEEMIADSALRLEAEALNTSTDAIIADAVSKAAPPSEENIKALYQANLETIGPRTLEEMRKPIIEFLNTEAKQRAILLLIDRLKKKFKLKLGRDVNDPNLSPGSMIAEIGDKNITAAVFEAEYRVEISDAENEVYVYVRAEAEDLLYAALIRREAAEKGIQPEDVVRLELTKKRGENSKVDRDKVYYDLRSRLFAKYEAKILLKKPHPLIMDVSTANEPFIGDPAAPVTVVIFSDFQCPACAQTDPVLKKIIDGYGSRVRLVVRDFPLESIHRDAFQAALAANAAWKQGRFFEFTAVLYQNQDRLDRESLINFAKGIGIDIGRFQREMADPKTAAEVREDIAEGRKLKISGTPTIFVNGVKIHRLSPISFIEAIESALSGK